MFSLCLLPQTRTKGHRPFLGRGAGRIFLQPFVYRFGWETRLPIKAALVLLLLPLKPFHSIWYDAVSLIVILCVSVCLYRSFARECLHTPNRIKISGSTAVVLLTQKNVCLLFLKRAQDGHFSWKKSCLILGKIFLF